MQLWRAGSVLGARWCRDRSESPVTANFATKGEAAVVELAQASGLGLLPARTLARHGGGRHVVRNR